MSYIFTGYVLDLESSPTIHTRCGITAAHIGINKHWKLSIGMIEPCEATEKYHICTFLSSETVNK